MPPLPKSEKLAREIAASEALPDHVEFVECLIRQFDGPAGLAKIVKECYDDAPKPQKATIARFVMKQVELISERGLTNQDVDTASEDDLERMIRALMNGRDLNVAIAEEI
jgi:hypothetical protein